MPAAVALVLVLALARGATDDTTENAAGRCHRSPGAPDSNCGPATVFSSNRNTGTTGSSD